MLRSFKRAAALAAASLAVGGVGLGVAGTAHAATGDHTTITQHITGRADSGNGGTWAYDNFDRTLKVTDNGVVSGHEAFTAVITDSGTFTTILGAKTPNQVHPGTEITHVVKGTFSGEDDFTLTAPIGTSLVAANKLATENDHNGPAVIPTSSYPLQAFAAAARPSVSVNQGTWGWSYRTSVEKWLDNSATNGNTLFSSNITGLLPAPKLHPYVYNGHVITLAGTRATVGWSDSLTGWPIRSDGKKCVVVQEYGPGFTDALGGAHTGYTCDTTGYLTGMQIGHGYSLFVWPAAAGDSYAGSHAVVPGSVNAHIYLVATAA